MPDVRIDRARTCVVALACAAVSLTGAPATAHDSADLVVSGGSVEALRMETGDALGDLRTHLGEANGPVITLVETGPGAATCYALGGEAVVRSNTDYDLLVSGADTGARLRFLPSMPTDFTACERGEPLSGGMFADSTWVRQQPRTAEQRHAFAVAVIARPGEDPSAALADASLTITARPTG